MVHRAPAMEMVTNPDYFAEMNAGTASDHFKMAVSHFQRSMYLLFSGGSSTAGDVVTFDATPPPPPSKDDGADPRRGAFIILPSDSWKEGWDLWVLVLILYSAVMVPYRICFDCPPIGSVFIFEQLITTSFITDVFLNFNTAYLKDDRWIVDRGSIAANYLRVSPAVLKRRRRHAMPSQQTIAAAAAAAAADCLDVWPRGVTSSCCQIQRSNALRLRMPIVGQVARHPLPLLLSSHERARLPDASRRRVEPHVDVHDLGVVCLGSAPKPTSHPLSPASPPLSVPSRRSLICLCRSPVRRVGPGSICHRRCRSS